MAILRNDSDNPASEMSKQQKLHAAQDVLDHMGQLSRQISEVTALKLFCPVLKRGGGRQAARGRGMTASIRSIQLWSVLLLYSWLAPFPLSPGTVLELIPLAEARSSETNAQTELVTQEFRYHAPEAEEVFVVWGVNGWQLAPESWRPIGTEIRKAVMHTPMVRQGDVFTAKLNVQPGSVLNYGFLITKDRKGRATTIWEADGKHDYHLLVTRSGRSLINARFKSEGPASPVDQPSSGPLFTHVFQYDAPSFEAVFLVWGVNGWQTPPASMHPPGTTTVRKGVVRTPMAHAGSSFTLPLTVPSGTVINFGFLIERDSHGAAVSLWEADGPRDFHVTVTKDDRTTIRSKQPTASSEHLARDVLFALLGGAVILGVMGSVFLVRACVRTAHSVPSSFNLSKSIPHGFLKNTQSMLHILTVNVLVLVICLGAVELVFGNWIGSHRLDQLNIPKNVRIQFDPASLYATTNISHTYTRDVYGLRGPYSQLAKIDLLTVGGSTTDQRYIADDSTWQEIMRKDFASAGNPISVVNAGIDGQSTYGHLKNFEWWFPMIPNFQPRYILFYVGINDFYFDEHSEYDQLVKASGDPDNKSWKDMAAERSVLLYLYRTLRGMVHATLLHNVAHHNEHISSDSWVETGHPAVVEALMSVRAEAYERRLRRLADKARQAHARAIFVTQYLRAYEHRREALVGTPYFTTYAGQPLTGVDMYYALSALNQKTMMVCRDTQSICIDLASELVFSDADFYDSAHNTPVGAEKIGHYLFAKLRDIL